MDLDESSRSLGTVWLSASHIHNVRFINRSDEPVTITQVSVGCNCSSDEPSAVHIGPRSSGVLNLHLNLSKVPVADSAGERSNIVVDLVTMIASSHRQYRRRWRLAGAVQRLASCQPSTTHFSSTDLLAGNTTRFIKLQVFDERDDVQVDYDEKILELVETRESTDAGQSVLSGVAVTVCSDILKNPGPFETVLRLRRGPATDGTVPVQDIRITGTVPDDVVILPQIMNWGSVVIGEQRSDEFVIQSRSGRDLDFVSARVDGSSSDEFIIEPMTADRAPIQRWRISARAVEQRSRKAEIHFEVRFADDHPVAADMVTTAAYYGVKRSELQQ